ncbi:MAG: type III pantothenate kinase [Sideroxydans sp.]|nr:type III pantothenate kinase [Sideroxydans sp.]
MKLLIDAGNSQMKFALLSAASWHDLPPLATHKHAELSAHWQACRELDWSRVNAVWASNVAGDGVAAQLRDAVAAHKVPLHIIQAQRAQGGVQNGYENAAQLGSDRWAALLAARALCQDDCLVVSCGTATTIDALNAQGEFLGGLILPGLDLMRSSLLARTAQLKHADGRYAKFPRNTADAIMSGALQATLGALLQQYAVLQNNAAQVILTGGAAGALQAQLELPVRVVENLVLHGIAHIAQEHTK